MTAIEPALSAWEAAPHRPREYLPDLLERVLAGRIERGKVFDLTLPLDQVAEGYAAMAERRSIKDSAHPIANTTRNARGHIAATQRRQPMADVDRR